MKKKKKSRCKQGLQEWLDPGVHCHRDMLFLSLHLTVLISLLGVSFLVRLPFYGGPWLLQASILTGLSASEKSPRIT